MASFPSYLLSGTSVTISLSLCLGHKLIDGICKHLNNNKNRPFCYKTLDAVASATTKLKAVAATIQLVISYADKFSGFVGKAAKENPRLKQVFLDCQYSFVAILKSLQSASMELVNTPETANYDAMVRFDQNSMITNLIGKHIDKASKSVTANSIMIEKYIDICNVATVAVGD